jgi:hypothetical protein
MDTYRKYLKDAQWTYLENKVCRFHKKPRKKGKWIGRMLKRTARQKDRKETALREHGIEDLGHGDYCRQCDGPCDS